MPEVSCEVPPGADLDGCFVIEHGGRDFQIELPPGSFVGDQIIVALPDDEPPSEPEAPGNCVEVIVPDGLGAGELMLVEFGGTSFEIAVPDGCVAGDPICVQLPDPPQEDLRPLEEAPTEPAAPAHTGNYRLGQRVQVLRSSGEYCTAFILNYHESSELYRVELFSVGSGVYKEGVRDEDISSTWEQLYVPAAARRQYDSSSASDDGSSSTWSSSSEEGGRFGGAESPRGGSDSEGSAGVAVGIAGLRR